MSTPRTTLVRVLLPLLGTAACATDPMPEIRLMYAQGAYEAARSELALLAEDDPGNAHVYHLEQSVTELAVARPKAAEDLLRSARDTLDDLGGTGAGEWLASVLLDDNQLDYAGADYERVMVRAMLAVANLLRGGQDADAYALQVLQTQQALIDEFETDGANPKEAYKLVAFGSYLRGILADDSPTRLEAAKEAFAKAVRIEPDCGLARSALERVTDGQHSEPGNGVIHVIALVGRAPFRVEVQEQATATALAIAQVIWNINRDRFAFPNVTSVPVPALAYVADNPTGAEIAIDGTTVAATEVVTDVEATATQEFRAMRDHILARAVLRRAFKLVVTEGAREAVQGGRGYRDNDYSELADIAIWLGGLLWSAAESADLRCWSLLPASFQCARIELPAGDHEVELRATIGGRPTGRPQRVAVTVRDGFNSFVVALLPTPEGGPAPLTSDPVPTAAEAEPVLP